MKSISLVDECIAKFIKGGLERFSPRTYGVGAMKEMVESGIFMTKPVLTLTEDGIERALHLGLISELKKRSMLAALERSGVTLKGTNASDDGASQVA
ncbi:hypothetical protein GM415_04160 [Pseudodesulfovibrio cashew]|uniref:Uncharacterized protein n=1 Tax=Pseudodesulfovibrio cashew TaxID=2678688 RepID=A0A6I6J9M1_9BACT|nr:hypothetical protein [Pseudodesulfovibrio cashew]QGY39345.1 hypothetical protein GM415_04160 [Pseudodesulfovibrio cashew]